MGLSVEDPKIVVVGATNNRVSVVLVKPDDPVVGLNVQSGNKFYFELGVGVFLVLRVGEGFAN